jgi:hypothetical protein
MTMDRSNRVERGLPALFDELAQARTPDYLEAAIERASARRQRPFWTFPERLLPMEIAITRVPVTRLPWRQLGVVALIALLLATAVALYVGSQTPRLPAPFGPAANGVVALGRQGDLYVVDTRTTAERLVVGGPDTDEWIGFTPDGTRGVFIRWGPDSGAMTAAKVGTVELGREAQPVFVQKDILHGGEPIEVAPNGRDLAFSAFNFGTPDIRISVGALDGSAFHTFQDVPVADYGGLAFLAPDGRELVYVARSVNAHTHDIRALDVATGETRAIALTALGNDIFGNVSAAPDGKHIAYALKSSTGAVSVHVVGTDGSDDRMVGHAPGATFEAWPQWDPQGRRLLIERDGGDGIVRPVIVDLGGGPDVVVDTTISPNGAGKAWAPDGLSILAQRTTAEDKPLQQELWDARTGRVTTVSWPSTTSPAWQRLAP